MTHMDSHGDSQRRESGEGRPEHPLIPAERVTGAAVFNPAGEKIGKVEDIAIEKVSGEVAYAILGIGGFLGLGERYHPVPWRLLKYDVDKGGYVIPCDKAELEKAPNFDREELSGWDDSGYRDAVFAYYAPYGVSPYWRFPI